MRAFPAIVLAAIAAVSPPDRADEARELYRRAVSLESQTGVAAIAEAVELRIDVPGECEGEPGPPTCSSTRRFARLYRIELSLETRRTTPTGNAYQHRPRGTVYLALSASASDEASYDEQLRRGLSQLSAARMAKPLAGLSAGRSPFGDAVAAITEDVSWACFDNGNTRTATRFTRHMTVASDGTIESQGTQLSGYSEYQIVEPLCTALAAASPGAATEEIRTMPSPRLLEEEVVRVSVVDDLPTELFHDQLVPLPSDTSWSIRDAPGVNRGESIHTTAEEIRASLTADGVETSASLRPARLPASAVREAAWRSRWSFEKIERRLGAEPQDRIVDRWSLTATLLPTTPPVEEVASVDAGAALTISFDQEKLVDSVVLQLELLAALAPEAVANAIVRHALVHKIGPHDSHVQLSGAAGWMLILCFPDGTATWGLPPTTARPELTNADAFCPAVEAFLPN